MSQSKKKISVKKDSNIHSSTYINRLIESQIQKILEQQLKSISSKMNSTLLEQSTQSGGDTNFITQAFNYSANQITSQLLKHIIKNL